MYQVSIWSTDDIDKADEHRSMFKIKMKICAHLSNLRHLRVIVKLSSSVSSGAGM